MDKGSKSYLYSIVLVAVLGGLLFGYDTAVISGAEKGLQAFFLGAADFQYTDFMHGFTSSSALIGCIIGALLSGMMATIAVFTALFIYKSIFLRAIAIILPTIAKCKDTTFFEIRLRNFLRRRFLRTLTRIRAVRIGRLPCPTGIHQQLPQPHTRRALGLPIPHKEIGRAHV